MSDSQQLHDPPATQTDVILAVLVLAVVILGCGLLSGIVNKWSYDDLRQRLERIEQRR